MKEDLEVPIQESEWQPAVGTPQVECLTPHHSLPNSEKLIEIVNLYRGKRVRIRETHNISVIAELLIRYSCGSTRFFEIHPDDFERIRGYRDTNRFFCEHQFITD
jgi:hypothetical protein